MILEHFLLKLHHWSALRVQSIPIGVKSILKRNYWLPSGLPTSEMPTGRQYWGRHFWVHHSSGLPTLIIRWFVSTLVEWNNVLKVLKYQPDPSPEILHSLTVNDSTLPRFILWLDCDTAVQSQVGSCVKNLTGHQLTDHQLMMIWWWSSFGNTLYYLYIWTA